MGPLCIVAVLGYLFFKLSPVGTDLSPIGPIILSLDFPKHHQSSIRGIPPPAEPTPPSADPFYTALPGYAKAAPGAIL